MCQSASRVLVVEECLALLERDGPISLPEPPLHARTTKVRRFLGGLKLPDWRYTSSGAGFLSANLAAIPAPALD